MSAYKSSLSAIDKLERQLAKCLPADKNIVRRKNNGDIIYETVRPEFISDYTHPKRERGSVAAPASNADRANFYTETPDSAQNGQQFGHTGDPADANIHQPGQSEPHATKQLADAASTSGPAIAALAEARISIHDSQTTGQQIAPTDSYSPPIVPKLASNSPISPAACISPCVRASSIPSRNIARASSIRSSFTNSWAPRKKACTCGGLSAISP